MENEKHSTAESSENSPLTAKKNTGAIKHAVSTQTPEVALQLLASAIAYLEKSGVKMEYFMGSDFTVIRFSGVVIESASGESKFILKEGGL